MLPGLVSVIVPVFNRPDRLLEAVGCVEGQTYRPVELIVVDDGSTDGTAAVCGRLEAEKPDLVRTLRRPNGGPGAARETGRLAAKGEFIQYLDSDDWLAPRKLEVQVEALRKNPVAGLSYCRTTERFTDGRLSERPSLRTGEHLPSIFPAFLSGRCWQTVSPLWRRSATDAIGPWLDLRVEEDLEYDARAGALGVVPAWADEALAEHRHHDGPRASDGGGKDKEKIRCRALSHERILEHAERAGVGADDPNMARYARELFLLARQAGAAGLQEEAKRLFASARRASGHRRGSGLDFRVYELGAALLGWKAMGRLSAATDSVRGRIRP